MKRRKFNNQLLGLCALSLVGMSSCVDNDYNLSEDVDMNVTVGGNITLPGSDTEEITLKKIFDLEPDCVVKADPKTGDYHLVQGADASNSDVTVDRVKLDTRNINIDKCVSELHFSHVVNVDENIIVERGVNEKSAFSLSKNDVTKELVSLNTAYMNMQSNLCLDFKGNGGLSKLGIQKGLRISLPDYMTVETSDSRCKVVDNHIVEFVSDVFVLRNTSLKIDLRIVKMDFSKAPGQGLVKPGVFAINDEVSVAGTAFVSNKDLAAGDVDVQLSSYIDIKNIELTDVKAVVDPAIDITVNPVDIDNLPDFLTDESVRVRLTDPRIYLTVTNQSPVSVNFMADLVPMKDGKAIEGNIVHIGHASNQAQQIVIPGNVTDYVICVHQLDDHSGLEADAFTTVPNLTAIVETIPEQVQVNHVVAKALPKEISLKLGKVYNVRTDYELNAPLQFNEGTKIVYSDSMDGWLKDTKDLEIKKGEITLDAVNAVPMDMELSVNAIDHDGNILPDVVADVEGKITAGLKGSAATSNIKVTLTAKDGSFRNLDGIKYRVSAVTDAKYNGVNLNEKQMLVLKNIKVKVIGGVSVDLN